MITVFADKYLRNIEQFIPDEVNINLYDPEQDFPERIEQADALFIRTVTKINEKTLDRLPDTLQFIGSASAGTDHVNKKALQKRNITFAYSAGCNARAVAEYVATALLMWADRAGERLQDKTVGIVGAGHVGSTLEALLGRLNIATLAYDPPREERESGFASVSLKQLLAADILSFHTPLTYEGDHPTFHWLDHQKLADHSFDLVINTARGGIINEKALLEAHKKNIVANFIIDVWEKEPVFNDSVAREALIKTPHIAGYSVQAKNRASKLVVESLCKHFSISMPEDKLSQKKESLVNRDICPASPEKLTGVLCSIHPILEYQKEFVKLVGLAPEDKAAAFNKLRTEFPLRNEFEYIEGSDQLLQAYPILKKLGITSP